MNELNDLLNEINNEKLVYQNQIVEYLDKVKQLINTPLKPYEYYKKFNNELRLRDYELIKLRLLHENNIKIDDYLNVNCQNCKNCFICYDCKNCKNCYKCKNCNGCENCDKCKFCDDCYNCYNCEDCDYCKKCIICFDCRNCKNCYNICGDSDIYRDNSEL